MMWCPYSNTKVWCDKRDEDDDNMICDCCLIIING